MNFRNFFQITETVACSLKLCVPYTVLHSECNMALCALMLRTTYVSWLLLILTESTITQLSSVSRSIILGRSAYLIFLNWRMAVSTWQFLFPHPHASLHVLGQLRLNSETFTCTKSCLFLWVVLLWRDHYCKKSTALCILKNLSEWILNATYEWAFCQL